MGFLPKNKKPGPLLERIGFGEVSQPFTALAHCSCRIPETTSEFAANAGASWKLKARV